MFQNLHLAFCILHSQKSWPGRFDVDRNRSPLALLEPEDAQRRASRVADDDRSPDVRGVEAVHRLEQRAQPERDDHLRDDRNEERTARITSTLQTTRVAQRDRDEQT